MIPIHDLDSYRSKKCLSLDAAARLIKKYEKAGKTVGLCHGGFDLLHPGHIQHFVSAKKLCDILVISVTSDRFVQKRKGDKRPIFTETLRAYMISHVDVVDYVVISDFETGVPVIQTLKPTYYIKGPDFIHKHTPGIEAERAAIASVGGEMRYTDDEKLSTTDIIQYIKRS